VKRSGGRRCQVVDTNVLVVANHRDGGSRACARNCARALLAIKNLGVIVLDDRGHILSEYRRYCCIAGQPGLGDSFIKWVHDNLGRADLVHTVSPTKIQANHQFAEFPDHPDLGDFDPADEVFIAVANTHPEKPSVLQASDSKWWGYKNVLLACGITVEFLCQEEVEAAFNRKFGS
jgi:hypothetical protein